MFSTKHYSAQHFGRPDLDHEQRRLGELRAADLVHPDHHEIRIELGLRAQLYGRLGHDAQISPVSQQALG